MLSSLFKTQLSILFLISLVIINSLAGVHSSDAGKPWESRDTHIVKPAKEVDVRSSFGGWKDHKVADSGYFRTIKQGSKWWLVDPKGYLFLSVGMNSVEPKRVSSKDNTQWAKDTHKLLTEAGFNTIGRWSAPEKFERVNKEIP